ncbi:hypothetical protein AS156_12310 [Bradyrhizobium macuxiense]|uniref:Uncharacterized protein n=1 Tax=Bradyrhizobium macuxiense TaxID=1755647 RepID=A0A109JLP3_9BRAD|nr:hypothetical protein [Bradyrhizobium macuxiense]KWV51368.1 hypothetical protein AS156_12310 [Bradyrhizobium macuxiense]
MTLRSPAWKLRAGVRPEEVRRRSLAPSLARKESIKALAEQQSRWITVSNVDEPESRLQTTSASKAQRKACRRGWYFDDTRKDMLELARLINQKAVPFERRHPVLAALPNEARCWELFLWAG